MKTLSWIKWVCTVVLTCLPLVIATKAQAQVPAPVMTIVQTNTNQLLISITNAVLTTNYELYVTPVIGDPAYRWTLLSVGTIGQTNFLVNMGVDTSEFYITAVGSDWDLDGIPNSQDADPLNPLVGTLTITIDSPANGYTFN